MNMDNHHQVPQDVRERAAAKAAFVKRLIIFGGVLALLLIINLVTSPGHLWVLWVALFGLAGFAIEGFKLFTNLQSIEKKLQKRFEEKEMGKR